jgi:hypothetical protein
MKFARFVVDEGIYNQPPDHFANKERKVVVVIVRARGTTHD